MRKEPKLNDKSHGQWSQIKPQAKKGKKEKVQLETIKKHGLKEIKWKPKNEVGKIQKIDSNWGYIQAWEATKKILNEV